MGIIAILLNYFPDNITLFYGNNTNNDMQSTYHIEIFSITVLVLTGFHESNKTMVPHVLSCDLFISDQTFLIAVFITTHLIQTI